MSQTRGLKRSKKSRKPSRPATVRTTAPKSSSSATATKPGFSLSPAQDWRTTDEDEINRRRLRARDEAFVIRNTDARFPVFSNFSVGSPSGLTYAVEVRDVAARQSACTCQDFRKNGLGTCKHVEAVLLHLESRFKRLFVRAVKEGSPRVDLVPDAAAGTLRVERGIERLAASVRAWSNADALLADVLALA